MPTTIKSSVPASASPSLSTKPTSTAPKAKSKFPHWGRFSGFVSYSYMVGNAWFPVTGGLFLGDDATSAITTHRPFS